MKKTCNSRLNLNGPHSAVFCIRRPLHRGQCCNMPDAYERGAHSWWRKGTEPKAPKASAKALDVAALTLDVTMRAVVLRDRIHLGRGLGTVTDAEGESFGAELMALCCAVVDLNAKLSLKRLAKCTIVAHAWAAKAQA